MPDHPHSQRERLRRFSERRADVNWRIFQAHLDDRGTALVRVAGSGQQLIVSNASGRRFKPGAVVPTVRHQNSPGEVIVGVPSTDRRGGAAFPVIRRGTDFSPQAEPAFEQWAFGNTTGNTWEAWVYVNGVFSSLRDSKSFTEVIGTDVAVVIDQDSAGKVGPGSMVWLDWDTYTLKVWDPDASSVYTYTPSGVWILGGAAYYNGKIWWIEVESLSPSTTLSFKLWNANADLTSVTQIGTHSYQPFTTQVEIQSLQFALTPTAGFLYFTWNDYPANEVSSDAVVRLPLSGGAGSEADPRTNTVVFTSTGLPTAEGRTVAGSSADSVVVMDDLLDDTQDDLWPSGGTWPTGGGAVCGLSADLATVSFYGLDGADETYWEAPSAGPYTTPTLRIPITDKEDLYPPLIVATKT